MFYDYRTNVQEDAKTAILDNYSLRDIYDGLRFARDRFEERLNDELWTDDSVTGNGSGSYTFSTVQAAEFLAYNLDLLAEAVEEFGGDMDVLKDGAEACDVTIRCYLLPGAIAEALGEIEEENAETFDAWDNETDDEE